ncbi:Lrp/AsnC family transcriptional regulator [Pseudoclavibacter sp. CFCC 13796]|uniref:Lrp/AsnC family transcriptional regulator n=1 Tax=Pseudoclavibacter sp. CFCC 13796 TaxID=2615179 RepID=UPI001300CED4|nr:Lrp/AsnC family transcriptional regulator [Pseudoclavibacter sp. CFCC 13796]KAB1660833.1 Lrp/AsnC family transcriptional regulator [Pseudoclavibacter sp. CFCC 13796]
MAIQLHDSSKGLEQLQILHALQLTPRAPWAQLSGVLGVDSSTLSRRWRRLNDAGEAWIACQPGYRADWYYSQPYGSTAYVEVTCEAGYQDSVISALSRIPCVWTVECTTGSRDLLLTVTTPSWAELDRIVREQLGRIDGVVKTVTNPLRRFYVQPGDWRLNALTADQEQAILTMRTNQHAPDPGSGRRQPSPFERQIVKVLAADGRLSMAQIADATGRSISGVSRTLHRLEASGLLSFRLDFNQHVIGYKLLSTLWIEADQNQLDKIGAFLRRQSRTVRECVSMVGQANLYVHMWVQDLSAVDLLEAQLIQRFPGTRILDRWLSTRFAKRAGHLIDNDGRRHGFVPSLGL